MLIFLKIHKLNWLTMTSCSETMLFTMDLFDIFKFMRFLQNTVNLWPWQLINMLTDIMTTKDEFYSWTENIVLIFWNYVWLIGLRCKVWPLGIAYILLKRWAPLSSAGTFCLPIMDFQFSQLHKNITNLLIVQLVEEYKLLFNYLYK